MVSPDANASLKAFRLAFIPCMEAARANGATYQSMARVRLAALAETPQFLPGTLLVQTIVRLSLASEARLVAAIEFTSRDDVQTVTDQINAAFAMAAEAASDDLDASTYMVITSLHAAITKYLADRSRTLPRVVRYRFNRTMTALRMSQRLYGNGARSDELRLENKVVHPAFMPRDIKALAV
jgi:prophage DNA circulation protein